jgi:hypothetical protein
LKIITNRENPLEYYLKPSSQSIQIKNTPKLDDKYELSWLYGILLKNWWKQISSKTDKQ